MMQVCYYQLSHMIIVLNFHGNLNSIPCNQKGAEYIFHLA